MSIETMSNSFNVLTTADSNQDVQINVAPNGAIKPFDVLTTADSNQDVQIDVAPNGAIKPLPVPPHTVWADEANAASDGSTVDVSKSAAPDGSKSAAPDEWATVLRKGGNPYPAQTRPATAKAAPKGNNNNTVWNLPGKPQANPIFGLAAADHGRMLAEMIKALIQDFIARHPDWFKHDGWAINKTGILQRPCVTVNDMIVRNGYLDQRVEDKRQSYLSKPQGFWPHVGGFEKGGFNYTEGNSLRECTLRSLSAIGCQGVMIEEFYFLEYGHNKMGFYIWVDPKPKSAKEEKP